VCAGERLKVPHAPGVPHVAVQLIPSLPGLADAASVTWEVVFMLAGGAEVNVTATAGLDTTVTVAVDDLVASVVDFAVIVIVPPTGTVELFWKVAESPLLV